MSTAHRHHWIIALLLPLLLLLVLAPGVIGAGDAGGGSAEAIIAGLSDEQVRQLLIEELQQETKNEGIVEQPRGPGAPLEELLNGLESGSNQSGDKFNNLWHGVPEVLPDLYKVLITL